MADFVQDLADVIPSHLRKRVERELINGWNVERVAAKKEALQIGHYERARETNAIDGVGTLVARIPGAAYHYWGQRLGYECWQDKQFMDEFLRDNPETAVRNYAKKTMVGGAIFTADGHIAT